MHKSCLQPTSISVCIVSAYLLVRQYVRHLIQMRSDQMLLCAVYGECTHSSHLIHRCIRIFSFGTRHYNTLLTLYPSHNLIAWCGFDAFIFLAKCSIFFLYWNYIFGAQYDALSVFIVRQTIKKHSPLLISKTHISNNDFFNTRNKKLKLVMHFN